MRHITTLIVTLLLACGAPDTTNIGSTTQPLTQCHYHPTNPSPCGEATITSGLSNPQGLGRSGTTLYWSDDRGIWQVSINPPSSPTLIASGSGLSGGLPINGQTYYAQGRTLWRQTSTGQRYVMSNLLDGSRIMSMATDGVQIYILTLRGFIETWPLVPSNSTSGVRLASGPSPGRMLVIDNGQLYWTAADQVLTKPSIGGTTMALASRQTNITGIALRQGELVWAYAGTSTSPPGNGGLMAMTLPAGVPRLLTGPLEQPGDVVVVDGMVYVNRLNNTLLRWSASGGTENMGALANTWLGGLTQWSDWLYWITSGPNGALMTMER